MKEISIKIKTVKVGWVRETVHRRGKKFVYRPRPKQVLIPIIRFVLPNVIARDIVGAQDMTADYNEQN